MHNIYKILYDPLSYLADQSSSSWTMGSIIDKWLPNEGKVIWRICYSNGVYGIFLTDIISQLIKHSELSTN